MLKEITTQQKERLQFIDWSACFLGQVKKKDLCDHFGIKSAAATRDFALYKKIAPDNIKLDGAKKYYRITDRYSPYYKLPFDQINYWLQKKSLHSNAMVPLPTEIQPPLHSLPINTMAALSRAIYQKKMITISYHSLSSGASTRDIYPFTLINNGLRWHVRAYDMYRERFADFVITRIDNITPSNRSLPPGGALDKDIQWNSYVSLELRPHPGNVNHPDAIEREYNMQDGRLRVSVRAAMAGYLLRLWNVDCSAEHALTGAGYHLWLANRSALDNVETMMLAPGEELNNRKSK